MNPSGGGSSGPSAMPSSASSQAQGAINITNSDGSLTAAGAIVMALAVMAGFITFIAVVALLRRS
jgi:hypothetical protein